MPRLRPRAVLTASDLPSPPTISFDGAADDPVGAPVAKDVGAGNYIGRLVAYIPAEVIAVYQAFAGPIGGEMVDREAAQGADGAVSNTAQAIEGAVVGPLQNVADAATEVGSTAGSSDDVLIGLGLFLTLLTPVWIYFTTREKNEPAAGHQIVIGTLAFFVWLLATSNPIVDRIAGWKPIYGSLAMVVAAALLFPLIELAFKKRT